MSWSRRQKQRADETLRMRQVAELLEQGTSARYWTVVSPSHHKARGRTMWSCNFLRYHVIMTFRSSDQEAKVSYRRIGEKGLPYTEFHRYPSLDEALQNFRFDFSQHLLELENAKPVLEDPFEVAIHSVRRGRPDRACQGHPVLPPAP